ncbi:hypothetical protein QQS21_003654 [Conoideocrella luteorostrata]|uniref:Alginate lyase 2 domain-containing protein n=1 Tax=Conoideocrella luteorostrata TaxID=1105319 RepID=A0AAJ0FW65_9HYPO|nr:hypothetical protein QQS21_003654 [Conoideocrella luteorostrata]
MRITALLMVAGAALALALDPDCAPGGNFDLTKWVLQEPVGDDGKPRQISSSKLVGCDGYQDKWFSTSSKDGSMVMKVPKRSECVSTPNSKHCRSELREDSPRSWDPHARTNRLFGDVQVIKSKGDICVGQIHMDASVSHKPVALLYVNPEGDLTFGVATCRTCTSKRSAVGHVEPNSRFTYEIRYEKNKLSLSINGGGFKEFDTGRLDGPKSYFKAGNYNQDDNASEVHFFRVHVSH